MIFSKFYHPIAVQIHTYQKFENVSLSGSLRSALLMNPKSYHGKTSYDTIPGIWASADCLDNTLLEITLYPLGISQFLVVYLSISQCIFYKGILEQNSFRSCFCRSVHKTLLTSLYYLGKFQCTTPWKEKKIIKFSDVSKGSQNGILTLYGLILYFVNILYIKTIWNMKYEKIKM